ncbi:MAG TPA: ABC transporter ATP-binding protein, partial [Desulfotomaculum sp.]|nr:ABC transporter ATP-binding protein [Desulfotomaculum sp.]
GLIPEFYGGRFSGRVLFQGRDLREVGRRVLGSQIGIVFQDPERQLVATSVEAEVAFGLESMGLAQAEMLRRLAEVFGFFGLRAVKDRFTATLSGGEKQKVALAAVLALSPRVLILDEPTSQLDPAAAEEILNLVRRLNHDSGHTVILIEQRLERCFHLADRLLVTAGGEIIRDGPVEAVARWQVENSFPFVPPVAKFFAALGFRSVPVTVKEGRRVLRRHFEGLGLTFLRNASAAQVFGPPGGKAPLVEANDVWFTYPDGAEALRGVTCRIEAGEFVVVMGENAAGKSTLLKLMVGLLKPGRGRVTLCGKDTRTAPIKELARHAGYLAQDPNDYLFCDTVEEELLFTRRNLGLKEHWAAGSVLERLGLAGYRHVNPRDLSSGERQRVALAAVLAAEPEVVVLDEPTRGIDCRLKEELGVLLAGLAATGKAVVVVTHDVEFAVAYAERVILLFDGRVVADGPKHEVLGNSLAYAPQMGRLFAGFAADVLTVEEGLERLRLHQGRKDAVRA